VSNDALLGRLAAALGVEVAALGSPFANWLGYVLLFTLILSLACWSTVLYWWYSSDAIGERLKQLE
jgi:hypothetical protein